MRNMRAITILFRTTALGTDWFSGRDATACVPRCGTFAFSIRHD